VVPALKHPAGEPVSPCSSIEWKGNQSFDKVFSSYVNNEINSDLENSVHILIAFFTTFWKISLKVFTISNFLIDIA
jgi:hypothetical protein